MKKLIWLAAFLAVCSCGGKKTDPDPPTPDPTPSVVETPPFAKGADISWASEMEAGGRTFRKKDGTSAPLLDVLREGGFNAIRLRVWVDPYKGWSGPADVEAVAKKVSAAGLALMVDFHYSDFFADPTRQKAPSAWEKDKADADKVAALVTTHTREVLQALKAAGVTVNWVQIGNETRGGMVYPAGQLDYDNKGKEFQGFVKLFNAGYAAAKAVYPSALVMPHLNNAFDSPSNTWWLSNFKSQGGKFDAIALSHYPHYESKLWIGGKETVLTPAQVNQYALQDITDLAATFKVPVIVSEVGVKPKQSDAASILSSFLTESRKISSCKGVFYWEPEVDGNWKPALYSDLAALTRYSGSTQTRAWNAYDQGAFTANGAPSAILDCFGE